MVLGDEITQAVFADPETAPIPPKLKAALGLVRKLTLSPEKVGPQRRPGDPGCRRERGRRDRRDLRLLRVQPDRPRLGRARLRPHGSRGEPAGGTGPAQVRVQAPGTSQAVGTEPGLVGPRLPNVTGGAW